MTDRRASDRMAQRMHMDAVSAMIAQAAHLMRRGDEVAVREALERAHASLRMAIRLSHRLPAGAEMVSESSGSTGDTGMVRRDTPPAPLTVETTTGPTQ